MIGDKIPVEMIENLMGIRMYRNESEDEYRKRVIDIMRKVPALGTRDGIQAAFEQLCSQMPVCITPEFFAIRGGKRIYKWLHKIGMWFLKRAGFYILEKSRGKEMEIDIMELSKPRGKR